MSQIKFLALAAVAGSALFCACASAATSPQPGGSAPAASSASASASASAIATARPAPADAQAETLFENACSGCHDAGLATQAHQTPAQWANTVAAMVSRGAPLDEQQAAEVTDYLSRHYGAG